MKLTNKLKKMALIMICLVAGIVFGLALPSVPAYASTGVKIAICGKNAEADSEIKALQNMG